MQTIVRKAFWDHEKEEKWLNEMSAKGFALIGYSWCKYIFTASHPSEYIYRIELLEQFPIHPESQHYLQFMAENGVEHIASYMRWVYFRKPAADGAFDIYSDTDSKINHYQRIRRFWLILGCSQFLAAIPNIGIGLGGSTGFVLPANLILGGISTCLGLGLLLRGFRLQKRINRLQEERSIME